MLSSMRHGGTFHDEKLELTSPTFSASLTEPLMNGKWSSCSWLNESSVDCGTPAFFSPFIVNARFSVLLGRGTPQSTADVICGNVPGAPREIPARNARASASASGRTHSAKYRTKWCE